MNRPTYTPPTCGRCGLPVATTGNYYMLRDDVWHDATPDAARWLCVPCLELRLHRSLVPADFTDVPLNRDRDGHHRTQRLQARIDGTPYPYQPSLLPEDCIASEATASVTERPDPPGSNVDLREPARVNVNGSSSFPAQGRRARDTSITDRSNQ